MKILLCSFGSHGDIHPYLALGQELIKRGQAVTFATSSVYRDLVVRHGLEFVPMRPEPWVDDAALMSRVMDARRGPETVIRKIVMPALRDTYGDLLEAASRADLLVSHVLTYAVPILAEQLGKPWASTVLSPMVFFSAHDVPVLSPLPALAKLRCLGPGFNSRIIRLAKVVSRRWSRPVADLRRELGLPPGRDPLWEGQHSPHLVLAMFSRCFGPPQPDWPPHVEVTGFPFLDAPDAPLDEKLMHFLEQGKPPLVFTLGSSAVKVAGEFYQLASEAARRLDQRAVLVAGPAATILRNGLPDSMIATEWSSFPGLFARASAVIHSGGVGTTAQALRAGVPQLVVPFAHDQFDNGERVRRLECGGVLYRSRLSSKNLARELDRLLHGPSIKEQASRVGERISEDRGASEAAERLIARFGERDYQSV